MVSQACRARRFGESEDMPNAAAGALADGGAQTQFSRHFHEMGRWVVYRDDGVMGDEEQHNHLPPKMADFFSARREVVTSTPTRGSGARTQNTAISLILCS